MKTTGYYEEYYVGFDFIGKIRCDEQTGREIGYPGKLYHTATEKIVIGKKRIMPGQEYMTIYYPLNEGR